MKKEIESKAVSASYPADQRVLKSVVEELPVDLTEPELREAGGQLGKLIEELESWSSHEKQIKAELSARKKAIEASIKATSIRLNHKVRTTSIEVEQVAFLKEGVVRYYRTDTDQVIRTRPLLDSERQEPLPLEEALAAHEETIAPLTDEGAF